MVVAQNDRQDVRLLRNSRRTLTKEVFRRYTAAKYLEHARASSRYADDIYTYRAVCSKPTYRSAEMPDHTTYAFKIMLWNEALKKGRPNSGLFKGRRVGIAEGAIPTMPKSSKKRIITPDVDKIHQAHIFCCEMEAWLAKMPTPEQEISVLFCYNGYTLDETLEYLLYKMNIREFDRTNGEFETRTNGNKGKSQLTIDTLKQRIYCVSPHEIKRPSVIDWWSAFAFRQET